MERVGIEGREAKGDRLKTVREVAGQVVGDVVGDVAASRPGKVGFWRILGAHLAIDGAAVAIEFARRTLAPARGAGRGSGVGRWLWSGLAHRSARRDPGERAAEKFLRTLGFRILARNWRSPRDPKDEADLVVETPCGREVAIVEVKRAAGPWDPLERVDQRKKEVLWRLLLDLERECHTGRLPRRLGSAVRSADALRVDFIAVRGDGRAASVMGHDIGYFVREQGRARERSPPPASPSAQRQ